MTIGSGTLGSRPLGGAMTGISAGWFVRIAGLEVTDMVHFEQLNIRQELNGRDEASLDIETSDTSYRPNLGAAVVISYGNSILFAGTIESRDEVLTVENNLAVRTFYLRCIDNNQFADRKLVVGAFESVTAGSIVQSIVLGYLLADGITLGNIVNGPTVTKAVFNYRRVSDCFDELAKIAGHSWYIDHAKRMNFHPRSTSIAPFAITQANAVFRSMRSRSSRDQYRNVQIVRGGEDFTSRRVEKFIGDGTRRTFNTAFPVGRAPTITVGGNPQTVGVQGVESGKQWYWNKGSNEITQDGGETILTTSNTLFVDYQGLIQVIAKIEDGAQIAARVAAEGGEGRYENIEDETNLDGADVVGEKVKALLARYGTIDSIVEFETDTDRLMPGQLVSCDISSLGIAGTYLILQVEIAALLNTRRRYRVMASSGEARGGAREFWNLLAEARRSYVIRENEVAAPVASLNDQMAFSDSFSAASESYANAEWGTAIEGEDEWGP